MKDTDGELGYTVRRGAWDSVEIFYGEHEVWSFGFPEGPRQLYEALGEFLKETDSSIEERLKKLEALSSNTRYLVDREVGDRLHALERIHGMTLEDAHRAIEGRHPRAIPHSHEERPKKELEEKPGITGKALGEAYQALSEQIQKDTQAMNDWAKIPQEVEERLKKEDSSTIPQWSSTPPTKPGAFIVKEPDKPAKANKVYQYLGGELVLLAPFQDPSHPKHLEDLPPNTLFLGPF